MKNYCAILKYFLLSSIFYAAQLHADIIYPIIYPALAIGNAILSTWFLIIVSIIIKGIILRLFIPKISYAKAMFMSFIGSSVSVSIGTVLAPVALAYFFLGPFSDVKYKYIIYIISSILIGYISTCCIELITLQLLFKYTAKQLLIPILVGNLIIYILLLRHFFGL